MGAGQDPPFWSVAPPFFAAAALVLLALWILRAFF
jgi:hypothetical protein